jgi:[NiFe] hydrogenase large subunit/hydrogenase large subunit
MASAINLEGTATINAAKLTEIKDMIARAQRFVEQVYWPDLVAIAGFYKEWGAIGGGTGNYLSVGEFPDKDIRDIDSLYLPRGIVLNKDLSKVVPYDHNGVAEYVNSSWYEYAKGDNEALHPYVGETNPRYTGPKPPFEYVQDSQKYTWMKAPRYEGRPMEVGPLAHMLVGYAAGHKEIRAIVGDTLKTLDVPPAALFSTLGRTAARGMETVLLARRLSVWYDELVNRIKGGDVKTFTKDNWEPSSWPAKAQGYGALDAPRGALGHWVTIENGKIANYQCVVPTTWNASPRDPKGVSGPYEAALVDNHPLAKPDQPLEILRTIHSFDPCIACGVHVLDAEGKPIVEVKAL